MDVISGLSALSRVTLYVLLVLVALFTCLVAYAQVRCLWGRPFENPDGTSDDWREQKLFYGIGWADLLVYCPLSVLALVAIFVAPRWGFFLLGMVSFWFVWANTMTTITSLRFEHPRITLEWIVVFPLGILVGLGTLAWILVHFDVVLR